MSIIRCIPNPEHMARAAAAIRQRWAQDASFRVGPEAPANVVPMRKRRAA